VARFDAAHFPFLARLRDATQRELEALPTTRTRPRQRLLKRGDPVDGAYFIVGGSLRVYYITDEGREATLYNVEPGGTCILALTSSFNEAPYPAWVDAGAAGGAFVRVPSASFRRLIDAEPAFRDFMFGAMAGRIFELMRTLEEIATTQIEQRVARYLLTRKGDDDRVTASQTEIASELGTAREVVFRALRSLAARGLIETGRASIHVLNAVELKQAATTRTSTRREGVARPSKRNRPAT